MRSFLAALVVCLLAPALSPASHTHAFEIGALMVRTGDETRAVLTPAELEAMPQTALVTDTPWTGENTKFTGVLLRDLLSALEVDGEVIHATALNDYKVDLPRDDATTYDVLVATRIDGKRMSIRDKGPFWIIYPLSQNPDLLDLGAEDKMIWQLAELAVE